MRRLVMAQLLVPISLLLAPQACHTRSETFGSAASSTISAARRRAALSKLAAEQGQRAAAAKAELTRQEAERARQEAELARQRAALEAQQLADEAERRQLELELLEEEEYGHQSSAVDRQALARPAAAAPSEPAAQLREPLQPFDRSSRTRDWVEQSSQYGQLCLHYDADISAATNVTAVISKLPAALALKWGEHAVHSGLVRPTLTDLDSWLRRYVAAGRASLTLTGHQQSKAEVNTWVRRFAHNSRSRAAADRRTGPLTAEELREAERVWLLSTQAEQFGDEIAALQHGRRLPSNSQLHRLNPFLDSNGLLRVGGQLRHAQLDFKVKRRVILPARGDITRLIVTDRHKKFAHSGAEHVLAHLRHHFWGLGGQLEHICVLTGPNAPGRPPPAGSAVRDTTTTATRLRRRNGAGVVRFD
ncbi:hypothetical protein FJT64_015857 [Amphibalanus amphitrite]|uniref:Integrase zinc-binding domain-containing protein n=1 Tax=Amphibalanus amphitrite TaxID=1232801 RepID=A0A6A4X5Z9_AMPAM|nr:hypothetical protein FJT64_015857 [Amphibalanus amphitrite]